MCREFSLSGFGKVKKMQIKPAMSYFEPRSTKNMNLLFCLFCNRKPFFLFKDQSAESLCSGLLNNIGCSRKTRILDAQVDSRN